MYIIYNIKSSIRDFFRTGEIHHTKCECGGDFIQKRYLNSKGDIDKGICYDVYYCKCRKCGKYKELDFITET